MAHRQGADCGSHSQLERSAGRFVKVNCAAIPAGLLESELCGHERGAYTGTFTRSIGRFERANRGTLFLDEIGDLPLELQPYAGQHHVADSLICERALHLLPEGGTCEKEREDYRGFHRTTFRPRTGVL